MIDVRGHNIPDINFVNTIKDSISLIDNEKIKFSLVMMACDTFVPSAGQTDSPDQNLGRGQFLYLPDDGRLHHPVEKIFGARPGRKDHQYQG
jgi:hypothetical protein